MYTVEVTPEHVTIARAGEVLLRLSDGLALTIGVTYGTLQRSADTTAQAFLHGVLLGLSHVALTGVRPTVVHPALGEGAGSREQGAGISDLPASCFPLPASPPEEDTHA